MTVNIEMDLLESSYVFEFIWRENKLLFQLCIYEALQIL